MLAEIVQLGLNVPCLLFPQTTAMGKPPDGSAEQYLKCTVYNKSKKRLGYQCCVGGLFPSVGKIKVVLAPGWTLSTRGWVRMWLWELACAALSRLLLMTFSTRSSLGKEPGRCNGYGAGKAMV